VASLSPASEDRQDREPAADGAPAAAAADARDWEDVSPPPEGLRRDGLTIALPVFEGPLDLLLHLIKKHEIDIFDIPIALITDKYMAYLGWMEVLDLDIAGEFLVMAATLAHIKSRMLLPPDEAVGEEEAEEEGDPREELVRRLLEYQRYKEVADELRDRPLLFRDVFVRDGQAPSVESDNPFSEVSVFRLVEALDRVMKKTQTRIGHEVVMDRVSIADRILELVELLKTRREVTFEDMFVGARTRMAVVATFLAILEMARLKMIRVHQADASEVIHILSRLEDVDVDARMANVTIDR